MAHVLVIEDNPGSLALMSYLLGAFGHRVTTATDGVAGLEAVGRETPDLVVCDIHLPGVDGYEVARRLKADPVLGRVPLVAVSALAMVGDRERGLAAGFDGYISKPIEPGKFVAQVEAFLPAGRRGVPPPAAAHSPAAETGGAPRVRRATLLVVDDSPVNRELLRGTLEPSGYEVWVTTSVAEALERLSRALPDLVLSDLHMPDEDGIGLLRRVKADPRLAALPFVMISSSLWGDEDRELALALGATRFMTRPIEPRELLDELAACLSGPTEDDDADRTDR